MIFTKNGKTFTYNNLLIETYNHIEKFHLYIPANKIINNKKNDKGAK